MKACFLHVLAFCYLPLIYLVSGSITRASFSASLTTHGTNDKKKLAKNSDLKISYKGSTKYPAASFHFALRSAESKLPFLEGNMIGFKSFDVIRLLIKGKSFKYRHPKPSINRLNTIRTVLGGILSGEKSEGVFEVKAEVALVLPRMIFKDQKWPYLLKRIKKCRAHPMKSSKSNLGSHHDQTIANYLIYHKYHYEPLSKAFVRATPLFPIMAPLLGLFARMVPWSIALREKLLQSTVFRLDNDVCLETSSFLKLMFTYVSALNKEIFERQEQDLPNDGTDVEFAKSSYGSTLLRMFETDLLPYMEHDRLITLITELMQAEFFKDMFVQRLPYKQLNGMIRTDKGDKILLVNFKESVELDGLVAMYATFLLISDIPNSKSDALSDTLQVDAGKNDADAKVFFRSIYEYKPSEKKDPFGLHGSGQSARLYIRC